MDMWYFINICARSWREFAKCRFTHFPSFFSVQGDTYNFRQTVHADSTMMYTMSTRTAVGVYTLQYRQYAKKRADLYCSKTGVGREWKINCKYMLCLQMREGHTHVSICVRLRASMCVCNTFTHSPPHFTMVRVTHRCLPKLHTTDKSPPRKRCS